ncbi:MAG TPA: FAD-dependent oxidoreductase, partial [Allosphingosinicella sp.]
MSRAFDVAIIGAGMAGASLAAEVAAHASVLILEAEDQPGYHATGRSAAFWSETYGGPGVQPLTTASRPHLDQPPPDFADRPFLSPRGALHLADASGAASLDRLLAEFRGSSVELRELGRDGLLGLLPTLRSGWDRGVYEPTCADIDVASLHAAYLRRARRDGARLVTSARLASAERRGGVWRMATSAGDFEADILVDAAGAWADEVAAGAGVRPLGIRPYRRTMVQIAT